MLEVLRWLLVGVGVFVSFGTLLNFSSSSHWCVRGWDFPRVQIAALAGLSAGLYGLFFFQGHALEWAFVAGALLCVLWQLWKIHPYTPLASVQVQRSDRAGGQGKDPASLRLLISNVQMENQQHGLVLEAVRQNDPDVVLLVETDGAWALALEPLTKAYPHVIRQPQDNYYGLMLFSRLPLLDPHIEFLIQDDIPSVRVTLELPGGERVFLHGIHPRPPEPLRDQDSTPRDAELVLVGRAIGEAGNRPTIVAGDLNDVAWSPTSELFLRLSGLLDPRIGRGFYNSYSATSRIFRYPLDHVFHSNHFRLRELRRLPKVGSDHFPMLVDLSYEPEAKTEQPQTESEPGDKREADEKLETQAEAAQTGDDRPGQK